MRQETPAYVSARMPLLTVEELADYLSCSRRTVERLVERGLLRPVLVGTRRRFRVEDVERYLERESGP